MKKALLLLLSFAMSPLRGHGDEIPQTLQLPPSLSTAGTGTTINGQPWAYLVWNSNIDGWLDGRKLSIYSRLAGADSFTLQGQSQLLTDPEAIQPWIVRAGLLGENLTESAGITNRLFDHWKSEGDLLPANFEEQLSALTNRIVQLPSEGGTLRQIGQARPLFRFITGTGWAGPLAVPSGTAVTFEIRDETSMVVGRVTLTAGAATPLSQPGPPVQVSPDFPSELPESSEDFFSIAPPSTQIDRSISLRWGLPEALRKEILLTSGFYLWRLPTDYTGPLTGAALESAPNVKRINQSPALASKVFRTAGSLESGPAVDDFDSDRTTWFVVDENQRYATAPNAPTEVIGTAYEEGDQFDYVVAAVDLLGRIGPVSARGSGVAAYQVPPQVPDVLRVENIMDDEIQRLLVVWKPNENRLSDVPATHYLIYRDRKANEVMEGDELKRSTYREGRAELTYLGVVAHQEGADTLTFTDTALTPQTQDYSHPYFYCLRAVHLGPLGYNISRPSPAVFGTLRDRVGLPAPEGYLRTDCPRVGIRALKSQPTFVGTKPLGPNKAIMRFNVHRGLEDGSYNDINWVLLGVNTPGRGDTVTIGSTPSAELVAISPALFFGRDNFLSFDLVVPIADLEFSILAVSSSGTMSHICSQSAPTLRSGFVVEADFRVIAGPILSMEPEAITSNRHLYWDKFFKGPEFFTPEISGPATRRGIAVGPTSTVSRYLLLQSRASARDPWNKRFSARIPAGETSFYFPNLDEGSDQWRYWEICESPFTPDPGRCPHEARHPGDPGVTPVGLVLSLPIGTNEYRIYRRIDDGPLALLSQSAKRWDDSVVQTVIYEDKMIPPAGGQIAYYGQVFDEHGNPGPFKLLETRLLALAELPTPILEEIRAGGDDLNPTMIVKALAPSPGVARIELVINPPLPQVPEGLKISPKLPSQLANFNPGEADGPAQSFSATYAGPTDLDRDPSLPVILEIEIPIESDTEYQVTANCIGLGEKSSTNKSAKRDFTWALPPPLNTVPWPARPTPRLMDWDGRIEAVEFNGLNAYLSGGSHLRATSTPPMSYPVAIRIGQIPITNLNPNLISSDSNWDIWGVVNDTRSFAVGNFGVSDAVGRNQSPARDDLFEQYLFKKKFPHPELVIEDHESSLFPFVVYRRQIARKIEGIDEPTPDTDLVQASHLVRSIVWDSAQFPRPAGEQIAPQNGFAFITDPWIGVARLVPLPIGTNQIPIAFGQPFIDLCYFDTTPVAAGSTYQYYLLHFDELGEPDGIIDAGTVTISE